MNERYSVDVYDDSVEIYGELTIEEAFDFLSFFERKGYKSLILGTENSTLHLLKRDQEEYIENERIKDMKDEVNCYNNLFKSEQDSHNFTKKRLNDVEALLKMLMSEEHEKYKKLIQENHELLKSQCASMMMDNPEVQMMIKKLDENEEIPY